MPRLKLATNPQSTPLEQAFDRWYQNAVVDGHRPGTLAIDRSVVQGMLLPWLRDHGVEQPDQVTEELLLDWKLDLTQTPGANGKRRSPHTVNTYLRAANTFLRAARAPAKASLVKTPRRRLEVLSREEVDRLELVANNERDKLIVRTLFDAGLRNTELCGLRGQDLERRNAREHYITVREGKGGRGRAVAVPSALLHRLIRYRDHYRPKDALTDRLFVSLRRSRTTGEYMPLDRHAVDTMVKRLAEEARIGRRVYPHLLRHSYATDYLRRGGSPLALRDNMGHSSLDMIDRVYSHLVDADRAADLRRILALDDD